MSSEELDMETEDLYSSDEEHKRAGRRIEERRFKQYRFISGPVTMLAIPALLGEHVTGPYEG